jgi:hypothetical protein
MVCVHILHEDPSLCSEGGGRMMHTTLADVQQAIAQLSVRSRLADSGLHSFSVTSSRSMVSASDASPNRFSSSLHKLLYPLLSKRSICYSPATSHSRSTRPVPKIEFGITAFGKCVPIANATQVPHQLLSLRAGLERRTFPPAGGASSTVCPDLASSRSSTQSPASSPWTSRSSPSRLGHLCRLPFYW